MRILLAILLLAALPAIGTAHPVPKDSHDRTILVRLQKGDQPSQVRVRIEYRLEVDEATVILSDMREFRDEVNVIDYRNRPLEYYAEFTRIYAPIYADRLVARVNKKEIADFRCVSRKSMLEDENGTKLGHLRCDFVFESSFDLGAAGDARFKLREQNYLFDNGKIVLGLVNESGLPLESLIVPDDALRKRAVENPEPGDDFKLREVSAVFATGKGALPENIDIQPTPPVATEVRAAQTAEERFSLFRLVLQSGYGFWLTLLLAFLFGAAHALTPGHGKTLVAAYLVGARGTVWHAFYLGLVTTLTHTGVVIAIAAAIFLCSGETQQALKGWIENGLGLIVGLVIVGMGFWLLLQRIAGRADHVHLDGGHHHGPAADAAGAPVGWWGITLLGMTGGMIPCWDAIAVLAAAVTARDMALVLPAVLVFSAGLASVLVIIGVLVVQVPRFVESRFGNGRLLQALPIVSAMLVMSMGFWLCYEGVHH